MQPNRRGLPGTVHSLCKQLQQSKCLWCGDSLYLEKTGQNFLSARAVTQSEFETCSPAVHMHTNVKGHTPDLFCTDKGMLNVDSASALHAQGFSPSISCVEICCLYSANVVLFMRHQPQLQLPVTTAHPSSAQLCRCLLASVAHASYFKKLEE